MLPKMPWDIPEGNALEDIQQWKKDRQENQFEEGWFGVIAANPRVSMPTTDEQNTTGPDRSVGEPYVSKNWAAQAQHPLNYLHNVPTDSVAIVSGGLDSTTLVYDMLAEGYRPHLLSFDYGQRHKKELTYAKATAKQLGLPHDIIDLTGLTHLISNSALTAPRMESDPWIHNRPRSESEEKLFGDARKPVIEVPEGHYAEESMKLTVVPNRNMIMLSIACGVAVNEKARTIGFGVHSGDHFVYPDCRPEFVFAAGQAMLVGNRGFHNFYSGELDPNDQEAISMGFTRTGLPIYAPFLNVSKADIAYRALELAVPLHMTWSCYKGGDKHCGRCGTCVERLEAIHEADIRWTGNYEYNVSEPRDLTEYEDTEFWKTAVRNG